MVEELFTVSEDEMCDTSINEEIGFREPEMPRKRYEGNPSVSDGLATASKPPSLTGDNLSVKSLSIRSKLGQPQSERRESGVDADDGSSFAESVQTNKRIRRTEEERILYFKSQPECTDIEPHRVLCTRCNSFVNLGKKRTYTVRPWELHRAKCDAQAGDTPHVNNGATEKVGPDAKDTESVVTPSDGERSTHRSESERKVFLESDDQAEVVQSDQVKCRRCQRWIKLSNRHTYALYHWRKHRERCGGVLPSVRVETAERKLKLVNDAQVKSFDVKSVECLTCGVKIILEGNGDYNLTSWDEHKAGCNEHKPHHATEKITVVTESASNFDTPESLNSVPFPKNDEDPDDFEHREVVNLKRARSNSGAPIDERPLNRPRTETYSENTEPRGAFGWVLQPLKAFVRGFRESLQGDNVVT